MTDEMQPLWPPTVSGFELPATADLEIVSKLAFSRSYNVRCWRRPRVAVCAISAGGLTLA